MNLTESENMTPLTVKPFGTLKGKVIMDGDFVTTPSGKVMSRKKYEVLKATIAKAQAGRRAQAQARRENPAPEPATQARVLGEFYDVRLLRPAPGVKCTLKVDRLLNIDREVFYVQNGTEAYWCDGQNLQPVRLAKEFTIATGTTDDFKDAPAPAPTPRVRATSKASSSRYKGYWLDQIRDMRVGARKYYPSRGKSDQSNVRTQIRACVQKHFSGAWEFDVAKAGNSIRVTRTA